MDHDQASVIQLLMDDRIQAWVKQPTPELDRYWKERLREHPDEQPAVERARRVLKRLSFEKSEHIDREGMLQRALAQAEGASRPASPRIWSNWYRVAAVLVGALLVAAAYWYTLPATQTHTTTYGESEHVVLPDGSTVVLNANSTLRYPKVWDQQHPRTVSLTGEAFFSVTHQANGQKFIVQTDQVTIEVLGTEFNVNHRRGETEVVLQTGSIRLDRASDDAQSQVDNLVVVPGELVRLSKTQGAPERRVVNPQVYSAWTQDRWLFENTPLSEIFTMIEDNYGYQIVAKQADIADEVFTAELENANLDLLLNFLSESFGLQITKDHRQLIVNRKATRR